MEAISFRNHRGETLRGFIHKPKSYEHAAIFLHGFPGNCEGTAKSICRRLYKHGILCLRFDFSGTRTSDGRFEDKLISQEVAEIRDAIDFIEKNYSISDIALIGTSTGAIDAALCAHKDRRVRHLVLMGMIHDLKTGAHYDFNDTQIASFNKKGYIIYSRHGKWYHRKRLKKAYYDEFFKLDIPKAMRAYTHPVMFIHGENDIFVPMADARQLFREANNPKRFDIIKGVGHFYWGRYDQVASLIAHFIA